MIASNGNGLAPEGAQPGDGTPCRALTTARESYSTDTCDCNNDVFAEGPCRECRSVFAAKREQLLASLRASEAQGWPDVGLWTLGVDDVDGEPRDTVEDVT